MLRLQQNTELTTRYAFHKQQPELSIDFKSTKEALGRGEPLTAFPPTFTWAAGTERNWDRLAQTP